VRSRGTYAARAWCLAGASLLACAQPDREDRTVPEPTALTVDRWDRDVPLPVGARERADLRIATSVGPGHNSTRDVYESDAALELLARFYAQHLPRAESAPHGDGGLELRQENLRVRLGPTEHGTRIEVLRTGQ
jgi:hypothetical protein